MTEYVTKHQVPIECRQVPARPNVPQVEQFVNFPGDDEPTKVINEWDENSHFTSPVSLQGTITDAWGGEFDPNSVTAQLTAYADALSAIAAWCNGAVCVREGAESFVLVPGPGAQGTFVSAFSGSWIVMTKPFNAYYVFSNSMFHKMFEPRGTFGDFDMIAAKDAS